MQIYVANSLGTCIVCIGQCWQIDQLLKNWFIIALVLLSKSSVVAFIVTWITCPWQFTKNLHNNVWYYDTIISAVRWCLHFILSFACFVSLIFSPLIKMGGMLRCFTVYILSLHFISHFTDSYCINCHMYCCSWQYIIIAAVWLKEKITI